MLLKSLELQGFKTFPDKTRLTFESGFTAVVGPNGSGKSNISDAMRWVLGEQSTKILRCSKMEDVIFSGTPQRKPLSYAEVTLNIDNTDRSLHFDADTVCISRRYYRSGESEYLINKASVRLKDINELFMDTGLGRDGYSIIGQGKISAIVSARSEERREIFEEAAGVSRFRYRKEEAQRRLDRSEENLVRLRDIFSELESRLEPLKEQAAKAEKFIAYNQEKKGLEIGIWLQTLTESEKTLRQQEHKIAVTGAQYERCQQQCEDVTQKIEENFRATNDRTLQMEDLRTQAAALEEEALRAGGEQNVVANDIAHTRQDLARVEGEAEQNQLSTREIQAQIEEKQQLKQQKEKALAGYNEQTLQLAQQLAEKREEEDGYSLKIEQQQQESTAQAAKISQAQVERSSYESSLAEIHNRTGTVEEAIFAGRQTLEQLTQQTDRCRQQDEAFAAKITAEENAVKGYTLRCNTRRERAEKLKTQLDGENLDFMQLQHRVKLLEDLERSMEGFSQSVKVVLREKERGNLTGVHGTVSRLITVPGEYAVAIETALGAAMQNIVVGTDKDAKNAISLLKRQDAGRATFLPLSIMKGNTLHEAGLAACEGFVGLASELCGCESVYQNVLASLLGRIVIAQDLNAAGGIAAKYGYRFRIVTLDGQVINAGGSFTGGSQGRNSGLLSRAADIARMKEELAAAQQSLQTHSAAYKAALQELSQSDAQLAACKDELFSLQEQQRGCKAQYSQLTFRLDAAQKQLQALQQEKDNAGARIALLQQQRQQMLTQEETLRAAQTKAEEKMQALRSRRELLREEAETLSAKLQHLKMDAFQAKTETEAAVQAIDALGQRIASREQRTVSLQQQKQELLQNIVQQQLLLQQLGEKAAQAKTLSAQKKQEAGQVADDRLKLETAAAQLRARERELGITRENVGHELARLEERRDTLQKEFDGIISKLWEEYELTRREAQEQGIKIEDLPKAQRRLSELKNKIKALGAVNVGAVVEYKEVSERYTFLKTQIEDVEHSKAELIRLIAQLTGQMQELFLQRFAQINANFTEIFKELFGGGSAQLSLTDENDVLNSGIEIKVHPPGKIVTHIEALSGGEMSLVAISIYFAIMRVNPPPFCMVDEIEAALDDVNVTRFAAYLHRMNDHTQIIAVTHRRGTMEEADVLYGVTMQEQGVSKLLELHLEDAAEKMGVR